MSLEKRSVPIDVTGGLSLDEHDFADDPPKLAQVLNGRFFHDKVVGKGNGAVSLGTANLPLTNQGNQVVEHDARAHLLSLDGTWRHDDEWGGWKQLNTSAPRPSRVITDPLVRTNRYLSRPDVAIAGAVACVVWESPSESKGFYQFFDIGDDTAPPQALSAPKEWTGTPIVKKMRIVSLNRSTTPSFFVAGYDASNNLRTSYYAIAAGAGSYTFTAPALVEAATASGDVSMGLFSTTHAIVGYLTGAGTRIRKYAYDGTMISTYTLSVSGSQDMALAHNPTIAKIIILRTGAGQLTYFNDDWSGGDTTITPFTMPASGAYTGLYTRCALNVNADGSMYAALSTGGYYTTSKPTATQMLRLSSAFVVSLNTLFGGVVLCGMATTAASGPLFALGCQGAYTTADGTTNPATLAAPVGYLVRPQDGGSGLYLALVGRFSQDSLSLFGNAGTEAISQLAAHLSSLPLDDTGDVAFLAPLVAQRQVIDEAPRWQVDLVRARLRVCPAVRTVTAQGLRLVGGGSGCSYVDGVTHGENTPEAPEYLFLNGYDATSRTAGNPSFPGTWPYTFSVVWRWYDEKGNLHRSTPSSLLTPTADPWQYAGGNYDPGKLCFPALGVTAQDGQRYSSPEVEVYAHDNASTRLGLVAVVTPATDPSDEGRRYVAIQPAGGVTVTFGIGVPPQTTLDARQQLYTQAGEIGAWPTPALLDVCSTQQRMWGVNAERRLEVWYTKPLAAGVAPEFSPELVITVPADGGDITGIAALDDKVIVFKRSQVYVIFGEGGDAAGDGATIQTPRLVSSDVGCLYTASVVQGPFGVAFYSAKGFYALDRSLVLMFIGADVLGIVPGNANVITYGVLVPTESEVRWSFDGYIGQQKNNGGVAAWNYRLNKWSQRDLARVSAAVVSDVEHSLSTGSVIFKETPDLWTGGTLELYPLTIQTPWLKLAGIAGYQRIWRIVLLLRWYTGGIAAQTSVDYQAATETVKVWSQATLASLVDGTTARIQLDIRPTRQKCESIRLTLLETVAQGETYGRGFELVGMQLEVGVKRGAFKRLPAAARG